MEKNPSLVCLGGGVGTVQLIRGLRAYSKAITVVASMADDGGSGGRLRRLFSIPPPGDLINCMAALSDAEPALKKLLTFRFEGNRWGRDDSLVGQKLGNLILVALTKMHGDFNEALAEAERIFSCHGKILPVSKHNVSIWAMTKDGKKVVGEETIDRGKYNGLRQLSEIFIEPKNVRVSPDVVSAIKKGDMIIAGPGDLYTTILPVLVIRGVVEAIKRSRAKKVFVVNIANKPLETPNYTLDDYMDAIKKHLVTIPFTHVLVNTNTNPVIPKNLSYHYVPASGKILDRGVTLVRGDLVDSTYPLHHDPIKLARRLMQLL